MSAAALSPAVAASEHGRIPVLDIGPYLASDGGAATPLARAIARTCEDTGFLVVANHGLKPGLIEDTFAVAAQFFARPEPDKLALKIGKYNIGYLPFGGQVVRHSPVNRNTKPNFSESFYITATVPPTTRTSSITSRSSASTAGRRTCPSSAPRRRRTTPRWRRWRPG
jgi:isopenicillin N synthase-like dioxygenase